MTHLDTQILVWLYTRREARIPRDARRRLDRDELVISPMVELELAYLHEIGRLADTSADVLEDLRASFEIAVSTTPFAAVVGAATALTWTRDPFDRLIVAQSLVDRAPLLTADATIREHVPTAVWD